MLAERRIAALVSGGGTNLQALIDAEARGELGPGRLSLVVSSSPGAYALTRAENAGIPQAVLRPRDYADRESYTDALIALLEREGIDTVVLSGFLYVLSPAFCRRFENRVLNVHPSLIPAFCGLGFYGLKVHEGALQRGVKLTGATVHFVNEEADGGPIIFQKAVEVQDDDTPESLQRRVMEEAEWVLLPRALSLCVQDRLRVVDGRVQVLPAGDM